MKKKKNIYLFIIVLLIGIPASFMTYLAIFLLDKISINILLFFKDNLLIILLPAIGGLIVGLLLNYGNLSAKGHGVPLLLATIKSEKTGLTKSDLQYEGLATTFTVITGGSVGLVGPIIELTTGITDILGRFFKFNLDNYQILIGSGAAASFTAVFNAPIAGIMFSLEVIHKDWSLKNIFFTTVASLSGYFFLNKIAVDYIYFFNYEFLNTNLNSKQYLFLILFTFFISLTSWLFIKMLLISENIFSKLKIPLSLKPMLGGLMVGIIGYYFFDILGTGSKLITNTDDINYSILLLSLILIFKIAATSLSIGSGGSGGLFAPMILSGLLTGLLAGKIGLILFPAYSINPLFLALCGTVGILAALIKAPITSILLILELYYLPNLIIPLIITSFIPFIILNLLKVKSIYSPELFDKEL